MESLSEPYPQTKMDFWGPYGMYAWEIFYYIPVMIADKYTKSQKFDLARKWLQHVYDPTERNNVWGSLPLTNYPDGVQVSAMSVNAPDAIARETPRDYRLATVRQYA